jgi:gamma-glutamylcyclotransferase (GGCT)/AIG2-like uncharacterized protein YtfP
MTYSPLFLYGTLRDPDILAAALGRKIDIHQLVSAIAPDHAAVYFPDRVYPALVRRPGGRAPGLLLEGASEHDRAALDAFEGDEYSRAALSVDSDGAQVMAEAYLPVIVIAADSPAWSLESWTARHKPLVIDSETATALAVRQRLSQAL